MGLQIIIPIFPVPQLLGSVTLNKSLYLEEAVSSSEKKMYNLHTLTELLQQQVKSLMDQEAERCHTNPQCPKTTESHRVCFLVASDPTIHQVPQHLPSVDLTSLNLTIETISHFVISIHHQQKNLPKFQE